MAKSLLGTTLTSTIDNHTTSGVIVEVEAYLGSGDPAAHSARGPTPRTQIQWGEPGHAYVYFTYGMHHCLNFVTEPAGIAGCVLIRAIQPMVGLERMKQRRGDPARDTDIGSGPAKLTYALGIKREHNGADLTNSVLTVSPNPEFAVSEVAVSPRIGISKGVEMPLRFFLPDNEHVSRHSFNKQAKIESC